MVLGGEDGHLPGHGAVRTTHVATSVRGQSQRMQGVEGDKDTLRCAGGMVSF